MKELAKQTKLTQAITPTAGAAGTSDIEGATLDMANFEGVLMVVTFGVITAGAVTSIKAQQSAASNFASPDDLNVRAIADDDDGKVFAIAVHKPRKRYVRLLVDRGTQNAVVAAAEYLQYGPRTKPTAAHGAGVTVDAVVSPAPL